MEPLLDVIAIWLMNVVGLPEPSIRPRIEFLPEEVVTERWIENTALSTGSDIGDIAVQMGGQILESYYDDELETIFLTEDWSAASPRDVSILIHEMVHHGQNLDNRQFSCPAARERLAYLAQERWLGMFGASLEGQFQIDPMTLLLSTKCLH